ncbi:uncharacterized protein LOC129808834 [Phlebotomus papatasi]|uniref:uncharacterized protein LOC129808834 n=1 Tax=Phlebotomus papatasi TaxID=29031 RepID=UPI0024834ECD|nr:uncharacterized protein LOC129808834 [Phlebotomus papatasi]
MDTFSNRNLCPVDAVCCDVAPIYTFSQPPHGMQYTTLERSSRGTGSLTPGTRITKEVDRRFEEISHTTNLSKEMLIRVTRFCLTTGYFVFQGEVYSQLDGVAMGSPISPIIADIVMQRAIEKTLENSTLRIMFTKKYVDDLLLAVHRDDVGEVLQQFNSFHPKIQYTMEIEQNGSIPYLDMMVCRRPGETTLKTTWLLMNRNIATHPSSRRERESPTVFHSVTYIPGVSERIRRIVGETLGHGVAFRTMGKNRRFFTMVKDSVPLELRSNVVYCIPCGGSSPYLATRCLNQLAQDEGEHFPVAAKAVLNHFYIDDCLMSAASTQEIVETQRQLIQIPRWAATIQFGTKEELHAFCDASKMAYRAAIYLIVEDEDGKRSSRLLTAKSKVASIDEITIPKLELCAATLGTILMTRVRTAFGIQPEQCFYWSDAMAVLGQIHSKSTRHEVFVRHRVKTIKDNTIVSQWRYRRWLIEDESSWPEPYLYPGQTEEVIAMTVAADPPQPKNVESEHKSFENIIASASDWNHAKKLTVCAIRENWQESVDEIRKDFPEFSLTELREAENWLIREDQQMHLGEAIKALKASRLHTKRDFQFLQRLRPFIHATGVMRVGGRLQESEEDLESIHPRIIPKSRLAELIARHEHVTQLHAGPQLLLSSLRRKFWPLGGRYLARKVVHYCDVCYRMKPKLETQVMGNLPKVRVTLIRPFRSVGMDFAGPHTIRVDLASRTKTQKAYVCVFVCMAIKAVHLEAVSSLSTEAFIACFRRFISRRNLPAEIYSDNGRNFVGADRELCRLFEQEENQRKLIAATSDLNIQWRFQSPSAPHHGGLYEAAVKSTKYHLKRVAGDVVFNFEEFNTLLSQVEATLNSRPLTQLSDDPTDPQPLTPGHFLTMAPLNQLPDPDVTHLKINTLSRWQLCQKVYQDFVKRWKREYLHTLQQQLKWTETKKNFKEGDIVQLSEESLGDLKWTMGRVVDVYRVNDGCVRTVKVSTNRGEFLRPITKLAKYPTEEIWGSSTPIITGEC